MTAFGNIVRLGVVLVLFLIQWLTKKMNIAAVLPLVAGMIISTIVPLPVVLLVEKDIVSPAFMHEFQRMLFYAILIIVVNQYKVSFRFVYVITITILLIHTAIQTLQWLGYSWITDFIRQYYLEPGGSTTHLDLTYLKGSDFRSGSIYLNPNVYMVIPLTALCVILQYNIIKKMSINYVWVIAALFSIMLTGSRTTLIISSVIVVIYLFKYETAARKIIILGFAICVALLAGEWMSDNFRLFRLSEGFDDSFAVKWNGFLYYIKNASPLYYFYGSLSSSQTIQIDAEWGYIYSYFGLLGLWWYIKLLNTMRRNNSSLPLLAFGSNIVIILVACSASVVLCMPIFTFFSIITLTNIELNHDREEVNDEVYGIV
jgi:hypothetical protein